MQSAHRSMSTLARLAEGPLATEFGEFKMSVFTDGKDEAIVLRRGSVAGSEVVCRIHSECVSSHNFFSTGCDCRQQMRGALEEIKRRERGIVIFLRQEGRGNGAAAHVASLDLKRAGSPQDKAYEAIGFPPDARSYRMAAKVLNYLQVRSVVLLSTNVQKRKELESYGVRVVPRDLTGTVVFLDSRLANLTDYSVRQLHRPLRTRKNQVLVVGDLNVDSFPHSGDGVERNIYEMKRAVGGTAIKAAEAFKKRSFEPIVFGRIGDDTAGAEIRAYLEKGGITSLLSINHSRPTGSCSIFFDDQGKRHIGQETESANDYDIDALRQALRLLTLRSRDFVFLVAHAFGRRQLADRCGDLLKLLRQSGAKLVLDVVPHDLHLRCHPTEFRRLIKGKAHCLIGQWDTLAALYDRPCKGELAEPTLEDAKVLLSRTGAEMVVIRYGFGGIAWQGVYVRRGGATVVREVKRTGYASLTAEQRVGFGDVLTADVMRRHLLPSSRRQKQ